MLAELQELQGLLVVSLGGKQDDLWRDVLLIKQEANSRNMLSSSPYVNNVIHSCMLSLEQRSDLIWEQARALYVENVYRLLRSTEKNIVETLGLLLAAEISKVGEVFNVHASGIAKSLGNSGMIERGDFQQLEQRIKARYQAEAARLMRNARGEA